MTRIHHICPIGLICLIGLIGLIVPALRAQESVQYSVHHYSVSDGLSQNTVMAILQDREGFMWFGTWDGLNRFDGYEFRTYKPSLYSTTLSSNRIDVLCEDSLGYIWMRTYGGAFFRLNKHTEQILPTNIVDTRFSNSRPLERLMKEGRKGEVWLAGGNNLLRLTEPQDGISDEVEQELFTLQGDINCLLCAPNGTIWAGTTKGVESIRDDERTSAAPGKTDEENSFLIGCNDGKYLWFGSEAGILWRYSPRSQRIDRIDVGVHSPITYLTELNDNALILTTADDGFVVYDKRSGRSQTYNAENTPAIHSNHFHDLYVDSRGDAWLENDERGIVRFCPREGSVKRYLSPIDERYDYQLTLNFFAFEDEEGRLWINPQGGGFACYNPQTDELENRLGGVTNMIHSACMDDNGSLWLGTYDLGLDRISVSPTQFALYDLRQDVHHSGELRAMVQLRDNCLVLATKDKRVRLFDQEMNYVSTLPVNALIYTLLENADGSIWMGSKTDGLFLFSPEGTVNYKSD